MEPLTPAEHVEIAEYNRAWHENYEWELVHRYKSGQPMTRLDAREARRIISRDAKAKMG